MNEHSVQLLETALAQVKSGSHILINFPQNYQHITKMYLVTI